MLIEEVYDALKEPGASDDKSRAAAQAIAHYETRFADMRNEFTEIRGTLKLHSWVLATNTAMLIALLFRVFSS
jgi:hypothetical protein